MIALIGDGALLACLAALPTAAAERTDLVWVLLNNGGYASIATYQARHFGRFAGTSFVHPDSTPFGIDYLELAQSFGIPACRVTAGPDLVPAIGQALAEPGPSLVVVDVTPTPRALASGHWDVNDILAEGAAGRNRGPRASS